MVSFPGVKVVVLWCVLGGVAAAQLVGWASAATDVLGSLLSCAAVVATIGAHVDRSREQLGTAYRLGVLDGRRSGCERCGAPAQGPARGGTRPWLRALDGPRSR